MEGVWYDSRLANRLRDEAPSAYKDFRAVLRAQSELVKVTRTLRPVLSYKKERNLRDCTFVRLCGAARLR